jgi:hypothetical protein
MLGDFLSAIILQIRISRIFCSIPYRWDYSTRRLVQETNRVHLIVYKIGRVIHATYSSFMACSFTHMWITSNAEGGISVDQILSIGWICCHCGCCIVWSGVAHKMNQILRLVNSFIEFEEKLCNGIFIEIKIIIVNNNLNILYLHRNP